MKKKYTYTTLNDEIIINKNQNYQLKDSYKYLKTNILYNLLSYIIYYLVLIIAFIYCKLILKVKYQNKKTIKDKGYFIYSNHTLTLGDVLNPFLINFPKRPYIICSPANLGVPIIGKLLPLAGAIPIPNKINKYNEFLKAIEERSKKHPIVIYPEAHLWPYYTKIRPFSNSSFHYPTNFKKECYTATTTYQNNHIIIIVDKITSQDNNLTNRENIKLLHDKVFNSLEKNSKLSNTEKYLYEQKEATNK